MISIDRLHDMAMDELIEENTQLIHTLENIKEIAGYGLLPSSGTCAMINAFEKILAKINEVCGD